MEWDGKIEQSGGAGKVTGRLVAMVEDVKGMVDEGNCDGDGIRR